MKRFVLLLVALSAAVFPAHSDPQDLSGGALITHYDPNYGWGRYAPPEVCDRFALAPLTSCEDQVNTIEVPDVAVIGFFVVAAWSQEKELCGVQFGLGDYDPNVLIMMSCDPCFPVSGLEIPSAGWPGPNEGTAFVVTGDPWTGNFIPVYAFEAYVYGFYGSTLAQLIPHPQVVQPFAGFANCVAVPQQFEAVLGGLGVNTPGTYACYEEQVFVCCVGTDCVLVSSQTECLDLGGQFHPELGDCGPPNPCLTTPVEELTWGRLRLLYR